MDVATEANGVWGQLKQVGPDGRVLDSVRQGVATPVTVVCPAKTICFAGGSQNVKSANLEAMVDEIVSGVPQPLTTLRFPSSVHLESAGVMTLSCSSAKSCLASGLAYKKGGGAYAFTATRNNGSWGDAVLSSSPILLGGLTKPFASSVWCSNATNCVVTGTINYAGAFASVEKDGIWSAAKTIIPNNGAYSIDPGMDPLSCSSISNCVQLYGATQGPSAASRSLAVSLVGGQWHKAVSLDTLSDATATSASDSSCTKSSCSFVLSYLTHKTVAGSSPYVVFTERFLSESSGDGGWVSTSSPAL
jgi:hypothetical protein